jgi:hypothetical protein
LRYAIVESAKDEIILIVNRKEVKLVTEALGESKKKGKAITTLTNEFENVPVW